MYMRACLAATTFVAYIVLLVNVGSHSFGSLYLLTKIGAWSSITIVGVWTAIELVRPFKTIEPVA